MNQQNFYLGCRVCRQLLAKTTSVFFFDFIPDISMKYSEAYFQCTDLEVSVMLSRCYSITNLTFQSRYIKAMDYLSDFGKQKYSNM